MKGTGRIDDINFRQARRAFKREPEYVIKPLVRALDRGIRAIQFDAASMAPSDTGNLRYSLLDPRAIGRLDRGLRRDFGLRTKALQRAAFYAPMVEFGTKGYRAGDRRVSHRKGGKASHKKVKRNIPARPAQPFLRPAIAKNLNGIRRGVSDAVFVSMRRQKWMQGKGRGR